MYVLNGSIEKINTFFQKMKTEARDDTTKTAKLNCILFSPLRPYIHGELQFVVQQ